MTSRLKGYETTLVSSWDAGTDHRELYPALRRLRSFMPSTRGQAGAAAVRALFMQLRDEPELSERVAGRLSEAAR